jgi:hypothetical protein
MTSEELCSELATHFNDLADKPIEYLASVPAETPTTVKETTDWQVLVVPFSESEESFDAGDTCREERVVSVIVTGPIRGTTTRDKGSELCKFLRDNLRETSFDGFRWAGNDTVSLYDTDALKTLNQFASLFQATFYSFG